LPAGVSQRSPRMRNPPSSLGYLLVSLVLLAPSTLGCSSSSSTATGSPACTDLTACCLQMTGSAVSTCVSVVSMGAEATCASTLIAYETAAQCGGTTPGLDAGHGFDTGLPCQATGTCTAPTKDSGVKDTGTLTCQQLQSCPPDSSTMPPGIDAGHDSGADAADVCGTTPVLHPETAAGVYCPFSPSGSAITCAAGQECCETPSSTTNGSTCQTTGTTCPIAGSIDWTCQGPLDCADSSEGPVCCGGGTVAEDTACGFERGSNFASTHCATFCQTGEVTICSAATGDCASGTCTPFKVAGLILGACQ